MDLKSKIRIIEGFPKEKISFKDITTLLKDQVAFKECVNEMVEFLRNKNIDFVVGPEARGFIFGPVVAYQLGAGFVPARKPGKLPAETVKYSYGLEYGEDTLEIHKDAIRKGMRVAIVDDLLATGGTMLACCKLIESMGGEVVAVSTLIELTDLKGKEKLADYAVQSLVDYNI